MTFNCKTFFFILPLLAFVAYGQQEQKRVAILNTIGDGDLTYLSVKLREIAVKILPKDKYSIMTAESIIDKLGSKENANKVCKEAQCLAVIGRKVSAAYVGQARVGRFDDKLTIFMELYNSASGTLVSSFTGEARDLSGLLDVIDRKAPEMFGKLPGVSSVKSPSPSVESGISGLQKATSYEADEEKLYVVNFSTEPQGAALSFDGVPSCPKTPCKAELAGGNVRIIAALEQYERADTTVLIKQNNQSIAIKLKSNFGIFEVKSAYLDGIGKNEQWSLTINGKQYSSWENNLSPNKYSVKLSHECYENISFDVGINKGKREVFDMSGNITLRKGGLTLSAERNGEPASEPVFVNGKQVGETPFSGSVPLCAKVEIGSGRELVDVKLKYNEKIKHTHRFNSGSGVPYSGGGKSFTDSRDGKKYRTVVIGNQTWMAENLNYNASGSKCYDNKESNCQKYGRLYNWSTAEIACPRGWHLPTKDEYFKLDSFVGGVSKAGKFLKAASGWNSKGNGEDKFGFSALPSGFGSSDGSFNDVGYGGLWWSASEDINYNAYRRGMYYNREDVYWNYNSKSFLGSVRCLQDN